MLSQNITDEKTFNEWLNKNELSEEEFLSNLTLPIRVNKYCESTYGHMTESRFLKRKIDLDKVVYSLIRVQDSFTANELYLRINAKEVQFSSIAKEYSLGEEKHTLGIVGPVSINVLVQEIIPQVSEVPIFVAGGIARGEIFLKFLQLGASGCQMGTRFVCSEESIAHRNFKEVFIKSEARNAQVSVKLDDRFPIIPVRAIQNNAT